MNRLVQGWRYGAAVVGGAAVLLALAAGGKYHAVSRQSFVPPPEPAVRLSPAAGITLGQPVTVAFKLSLPWHIRPGKVAVVPGEGTQALGQPRIRRARLGWGWQEWEIAAIVQPYRDGEVGAGSINYSLTPVAAAPGAMTVAIPGFKVNPRELSGQDAPQLAGKLSPTWRDRWDALLARPWRQLVVIILGGLLVLCGLGWLIYRLLCRRLVPPPPLPPWEIALRELGELRTALAAGSLAGEAALQRLSDLVRNYLEARFHLHAPRQTTVEFLRELERESSPLADTDRQFLKDFLTAGDLVKFARQPADLTAIANAATRAEALVRGTIPPPPTAGPHPAGG